MSSFSSKTFIKAVTLYGTQQQKKTTITTMMDQGCLFRRLWSQPPKLVWSLEKEEKQSNSYR